LMRLPAKAFSIKINATAFQYIFASKGSRACEWSLTFRRVANTTESQF
jgi:hypothetical protein